MAVFTAIGTFLGASAATAFSVGVGATAIAAAVGVGAFAAAGGFDSDSSVDERVQAATGTGQLTAEEAYKAAKKRAYRAGILHTSPTGLDNQPKTSSAKLK